MQINQPRAHTPWGATKSRSPVSRAGSVASDETVQAAYDIVRLSHDSGSSRSMQSPAVAGTADAPPAREDVVDFIRAHGNRASVRNAAARRFHLDHGTIAQLCDQAGIDYTYADVDATRRAVVQFVKENTHYGVRADAARRFLVDPNCVSAWCNAVKRGLKNA